MAEISYPFAAASAGGGSQLVSQGEWQNMAHLWAPDGIDFRLENPTYTNSSLPFWCEFTGTDIIIHPGSAWVGGFYYKNDSPWSAAAPVNAGSNPRIDLIVLRTNFSTGSVNLARVEGQPAAVPKEPMPQRVLGGVWEMPLWAVELAANNGARTPKDRRQFSLPGSIAAPWYASEVAQSAPAGTIVYDMDVNNVGGQSERWRGTDGFVITRHLGRRRTYTPDMFTVSNKPAAANRTGYFRNIAPGTISVSLEIRNTSTRAVTLASGASLMGVTLPYASSSKIRSLLTGFLDNPEKRDGMPNMMEILGRTSLGTSNVYLSQPSYESLAEGHDGVVKLPGKSTLNLHGVYETNDFE